MKGLVRLLTLAIALLFVVVACGGGGDSKPADSGVVLVDDNVFKPKETTVKVGDTVAWQFEGNSAHNVVSDDFKSELMKQGSYEHTFDKAGSFSYRCTVHTGMNGTVVVE